MDLLLAQVAQAAQSDPTALGVAIAAGVAAIATGAKQIADAIKSKGLDKKAADEHSAISLRLDKIDDKVDETRVAVGRIEGYLESRKGAE